MTRILIADDHDVVRSGVRAILEAQAGWEIVGEAADGKEAVNLALATRPDVVVLDYALPVLNGIEATRQIRARVPGAEVLIFTMHDTASWCARCSRPAPRLPAEVRCPAFLVAAVEALAEHKTFFTSKVSETLLESYLSKDGPADAPDSREKSIVKLIAEGRTNKEMAEVLSIGAKTVETHRASALRKLNLETTADLIRYAIRNKIVEL